jgi:hypothetical protein
MTVLRNVMLVLCAVIYIYTFVVLARDGFWAILVFFEDLVAFNWSGQFNLDFGCYLLLSGLWLAWRSGFSTSGIVRGALASTCGMLYFAPQMLVLILRSKGDLRGLLLGVHASK